MTEDRQISELFVTMADWMRFIGVTDASKGVQPWRGQLETPSGAVLKVALNASKAPVDNGGLELAPYTASITSDDIIAVALINPYGGVCGGVNEDYLIDAFKHAMKAAA